MRYIESVATLELDVSTCNGCTLCTLARPHGVFEVTRPAERAIVDRNALHGVRGMRRELRAGRDFSLKPGVGSRRSDHP